MKLHVLSDLHLSVEPFTAPATHADLVILAGDLARPDTALAWARALSRRALYVPGNHEFYGSSPAATLRALREASAGSQVQVLSDEAVVIEGVRFLGATLWTDFGLHGAATRERAQAEAAKLLRDFSRIRLDPPAEALFAPRDAVRLHERSRAWLADQLEQRFEGPTVVITHHAPSPRSVHPRWEGSPINSCFVSDLESLMGGARVALWIHGHTHDSFDYVVNGTRVVCNPRGYCRGGAVENPAFDPALVLEV